MSICGCVVLGVHSDVSFGGVALFLVLVVKCCSYVEVSVCGCVSVWLCLGVAVSWCGCVVVWLCLVWVVSLCGCVGLCCVK